MSENIFEDDEEYGIYTERIVFRINYECTSKDICWYEDFSPEPDECFDTEDELLSYLCGEMKTHPEEFEGAKSVTAYYEFYEEATATKMIEVEHMC